jgi:serine/threonine-protein kinase
MNSCPICQGKLEPSTLLNEAAESLWTCRQCGGEFFNCFRCRRPTTRQQGEVRTCLAADCETSKTSYRRCSTCGRWSVPVSGETAVCLNPDCPPTVPVVAATVIPPTSTYIPDEKEGPAEAARMGRPPVEVLLDRIAAQSHFEERYTLRERVFGGGMGEVWSAVDQILGREVAVKVARSDRADDALLRGQFIKEARVGGRLLHPNVLPVFDLGVTRDRRAYFTMRLVRGASLAASLDAVATGCATNLVDFPLRPVVAAFVRACRGVDFAHENGILHLDLKPHNILVSGFQEVFVIDWGLARVDDVDDTERLLDLYHELDSDGDFSGATGAGGGRIVGTPGYMAPEQATGKVELFGPATDVFGLGGVLYYILYSTPPLRAASGPRDFAAALEASHQPQRRGRLREGILPRGRRVPEPLRASLDALEGICLRALERDPARRYRRVEDMIIDLNEWLGHPAFEP